MSLASVIDNTSSVLNTREEVSDWLESLKRELTVELSTWRTWRSCVVAISYYNLQTLFCAGSRL